MAVKKVVTKRDYEAPIEEVWTLWTTAKGIESWWGPDGFRVEVQKLDLRPGGELLYTMIATGRDQIAFMKNAGMSTAHKAKITYLHIEAPTGLAYTHAADFIPGVKPYDVDTVVELEARGKTTHLTLTFDRMHDDEWTDRASMGWRNELEKLSKQLDH